ncbi:MAG: right-handed parallel beta-helix repeat-containing protein [Victivallaceae bacterium]
MTTFGRGFQATLALTLLALCSPSAWAGDYDKELAEVKAGTRTEAKASWWGFNKEDSTKALQNAIDSGVKRLVVDNTGHDWSIEPVKLASNQEIVFEKGVVVIARKGAFKALDDSLFSARGRKNITLRGESDAILKMRKADYHDAATYSPSEWRNAISLLSSENITIKNLTIASSGGDGIYIGCQRGAPMNYSKDILIEDVVCDDHNRQGISVISVENLTIKDSVFKNTNGTAPKAGIDFEPNFQNERLVNCVLENCIFTGNGGAGVDFCLRSDMPVSIVMRNCRIYGNRRGVCYAVGKGKTSLSDNISLINCEIGGSAKANVKIQCANTNFLFKDCAIDNAVGNQSAIVISEMREHAGEGVVEFDNVKVTDNTTAHTPLSFSTRLVSPKVKIKGAISFTQPGTGTRLIDCAGSPEAAYFKTAGQVDFRNLTVSQTPVSVPANAIDAIIPVRYEGKFIQFAEKGKKIAFEMIGVRVGKNNKLISMRVKSPKGLEVINFKLEPVCSWKDLTNTGSWKRMEFVPEETGAYTIECVENRGNAFLIRSNAPGNGYLVENEFHMVCPKGKLFFQVPAGLKDVRIEVFGEQDESLSAALLNANGTTVHRLSNIEDPGLLSFKRIESSKSEIWAVEFSNAVEDSYMRIGDGLIPIVSETPASLPLLQ